MESMSGKPVIAGFDGSAQSRRALCWAASEAARRALPLHVVHTVQWPSTVRHSPAEGLSADLKALIGKDIEQSAAECGGTVAEVSILEGSPTGTLCDLSHDAAMLVLGARGEGGFAGQLIGSVSLSVAIHASCPVVVVRGHERPSTSKLPVVAGIDGVQAGAKVLQFALAEGAARDCPVLAVRASIPSPGLPDAKAADHRVLEGVIAIHRQTYPEVEMWAQLDEGEPAQVLTGMSKSAQLVVVGARGTGGFSGLLLGSVSQQLLHFAECPVAVVR